MSCERMYMLTTPVYVCVRVRHACSLNKKHRMSGYPTEHYDTESYGKQFKNHAVRRFAHAHNGSIFGGLNEYMSGVTKTKNSQY